MRSGTAILTLGRFPATELGREHIVQRLPLYAYGFRTSIPQPFLHNRVGSIMAGRGDGFFSLLLSALFLTSLVSISAQAGDIDGDGFEDSSDDCPYAPGDSTVDRNGCPDRDGDGTSDRDDGWTSSNPNFSIDVSVPQSYDFFDVDFSPDGEFVVSSDENGYVRIWNSTTGINNDRDVPKPVSIFARIYPKFL